ncbi:MAG: hypothetical protein QNJ11_05750 [Woeseiaceae bacterium]|nr:hypothetical protein [Woeseiaceae bacterium]
MNGNNGDDETDIEDSEDEEFSEDLSSDDDKVADIGTETIVGTTAEFKVDEIVAKIDKADPGEVAHKREVRKRLDEIEEKRSEDLDSTFNFNLDDDL